MLPGERRRGEQQGCGDGCERISYLFLVNHGDDEARVDAAGLDLLDGSEHEGEAVLPPGGVRVLLERDR
jgi:beta-galactosidase